MVAERGAIEQGGEQVNPLILKAALSFSYTHRTKLLLALCIIFIAFTFRECRENVKLQAELTACLSKPAPKVETASSQAQRVVTKVQIVYKDKASTCPDVAIESDSSAFQGVTATATAEGGLKMASRGQKGPFALSVGAAYAWDEQAYRGALGGSYWFDLGHAEIGLEAFATYPLAWNGPQKEARPGIVGMVSLRP
jgi:hypothetical protein